VKWGLVLLTCLVLARPVAAASNDVLVVATEDAELAQALVRAASQQFAGPVALAPASWSGPVQAGTLRLRVIRQPRGWRVILSGPEAAVSRDLAVHGAAQLDLAESIALALPGLQSRLSERSRGVEDARRSRDREVAAAATPPSSHSPPAAPRTDSPAAVPVPAPPSPEKPLVVERLVLLPVRTALNVVSLGLTVGPLLARHLQQGGADLSGQVSFHGPWFARLSLGAYGTSFHDTYLTLVPIDALFGVRFLDGVVRADVAVGGELNMAATSVSAGVTTSLVAQATVSARVWRTLSVGLRVAGSYTTDSAEVDDSIGRGLYMPQAQLRLGAFFGWDLD
jgi:hypothetical protein